MRAGGANTAKRFIQYRTRRNGFPNNDASFHRYTSGLRYADMPIGIM